MAFDRRSFLKVSAAGLASVALPLGLPGRARAATSRNVLVVVFLRGGADGVSLVVPTGDPGYYALRPTLQVPPGQELPITDFFGMNPALSELEALYRSQQLSVIHAVGSTDESRSHFDQQDFMERAAPGNKSVSDGWLNRYLSQVGGGQPLAGLSLGHSKEPSLSGPARNLSLSSIRSFGLQGPYAPERSAALSSLHGADPGSLLAERTAETLAVVDTITGVSNDTTAPYPRSALGRRLGDIAALIKADVGVQVAAVSRGGWDTHAAQLDDLATPMRDLSQSLDAFQIDLGADAARVMTLVMTEFGRTAGENGTFGTDHGRASLIFALNGGIQGGRVLLRDDEWPALSAEDPYRDLVVTTDFRDVFAEVLDRHLAAPDVSAVFPGWTPQSDRYPGLYT